MGSRNKKLVEIGRRAAESVDGFVMTENLSRSFSFRHKSGSSIYFHTLTWSPGVLTLFGDAGELVLRHWQALQHFKAGMAWAAESDVGYLLEKSDKSTVLDIDATLAYLAQSANEEPIVALWGYARRWVRRDKDTGEFKEEVTRVTGAIHEMRAYRRLPADERECRPEVMQSFTQRHSTDFGRRLCERDGWSFDDAWSRWFRIWQRAIKEGLIFSDDPGMVQTAKGRRKLKKALADLASNEPHEFISFLASLDQDYYGTHDYKESDRFKVEVIKIGARRIIENMKATQDEIA